MLFNLITNVIVFGLVLMREEQAKQKKNIGGGANFEHRSRLYSSKIPSHPKGSFHSYLEHCVDIILANSEVNHHPSYVVCLNMKFQMIWCSNIVGIVGEI